MSDLVETVTSLREDIKADLVRGGPALTLAGSVLAKVDLIVEAVIKQETCTHDDRVQDVVGNEYCVECGSAITSTTSVEMDVDVKTVSDALKKTPSLKSLTLHYGKFNDAWWDRLASEFLEALSEDD